MKKIITALVLLLCLSGCTEQIMDMIDPPAETPEAVEEPVQEPVEEKESASINPNEVTEYDRRAVTSLINRDLKNKYGKGMYYTVYADDVTFTKKNGKITATGNYTYYDNGNLTLPFEYIFIDQNTEYELVSADIGKEFAAQETTAPNIDDLSGRAPNRTYDFNASQSITVSASHSGDGTLLIKVVDGSGKTVKEVFNQSGDFDSTVTVDLDPGSYQLWVVCNDGYWSIRYSTV